MSCNINRVIIGGNLTRDPETRRSEGPTPSLVVFSIANNRRWRDSQGEAREEVSYVDCEAWGRAAALIAEHWRKGKPILIEGRIKQDRWEKDGEKRQRLVIIVERAHFVDSRDPSQPQEAAG